MSEEDFKSDVSEEEEDFKKNHSELVRMADFVNEISILIIKSGILINGGGAIALMTFMGKGDNPLTQWPLMWFVLGVLASISCACFTYLAHIEYIDYIMDLQTHLATNLNEADLVDRVRSWYIQNASNKTSRKRGDLWRNIAIGCMVAVVVCFAVGSLLAAYQMGV